MTEASGWVLSDALQEFAADGDFDLVREIIDLFLVDSEDRIDSLAKAASSSDLVAVRRIAHGLKGAARQMAITSLSERAEYLEENCAGAESADLNQRCLELRRCWEEVKQAVLATRCAFPV